VGSVSFQHRALKKVVFRQRLDGCGVMGREMEKVRRACRSLGAGRRKRE
jgi:hypothetical protein